MSNSVNSLHDIRSLSQIEAMRVMPGMYIGGTDQRALHGWLFEAITDAIAEVNNRPDARIDVTIGKRVAISDNGEGYSLAIFQYTLRPMLERIMTLPNASNKRRFKFHLIDSMVGISIVNALSSEFTIQVKQSGWLWQQTYEAGEQTSEIEAVRELEDGEQTGTIRIFKPDFTIFQEGNYDHQLIRRRLREYAFLLPGLTIGFEDKRRSAKHKAEVLNYPNGIQDFIEFVNRDTPTLHPPLIIREEMEIALENDPNAKHPFKVEMALQFTDTQQEIELGFINAFEIVDGGTHIHGIRRGVSQVLNEHLKELEVKGKGQKAFILEDKFANLTVIVSMWYAYSQWESGFKWRLINAEIEKAIAELVTEKFELFATQYPEYMQTIIQKCIENRDARLQRRYGDVTPNV